jgi:hypothetical protein
MAAVARPPSQPDAGSATVNHINPKMVALGPTFCRSLLVEASVIENAKIRVYLHVRSDSDDGDIKNLKHLEYSVDCKVTCNVKLCFTSIQKS